MVTTQTRGLATAAANRAGTAAAFRHAASKPPIHPPVKLRGPGKRSISARSSRPPLGATRDASAAVRGGGSATPAGSRRCRAESAPGPERRTTAMAARPWALLSAKMVSRTAAEEEARAHGATHGWDSQQRLH